MTTETPTRQDWLHVLIKIQMAGGSATTGEAGAQNKGSLKRNQGQLCISIRLVLCLADVLSLHDRRCHSGTLTPRSEHSIADFHKV